MMSDNSSINGIDLSSIGLHGPLKTQNDKTEKDEFLQLFIAQLRNQNPLEPQDGSDFLAQLAQFSTVEGIKNMEGSFNRIADSLNSNQALNASQLVGKKVHVRTDVGLYAQGDKIAGAIEIPKPVSDLTLEVRNEAGQLIKTYQYNAREKGDFAFYWDGLDEQGNGLPEGAYYFTARATVDGQVSQLNTYLASNVDSVTINKNGQPMTLNVSGYGKISLSDIKTIS